MEIGTGTSRKTDWAPYNRGTGKAFQEIQERKKGSRTSRSKGAVPPRREARGKIRDDRRKTRTGRESSQGSSLVQIMKDPKSRGQNAVGGRKSFRFSIMRGGKKIDKTRSDKLEKKHLKEKRKNANFEFSAEKKTGIGRASAEKRQAGERPRAHAPLIFYSEGQEDQDQSGRKLRHGDQLRA